MQPSWEEMANQYLERDVKCRMAGKMVRVVVKMHTEKVEVAPA